jgi:hypothetical protein
MDVAKGAFEPGWSSACVLSSEKSVMTDLSALSDLI